MYSSKKVDIISVGYTMNFTSHREALKNILAEKLQDYEIMNKYDIPDIVHSGVLYNQYAKQIHDQRSSDAEMKTWYSKHSDVEKIYIRAFYLSSKILILDAYSGKDTFFIVASNMTKGLATTMHKRNALNGQYGPRYEIERFEIPATAYIHRT